MKYFKNIIDGYIVSVSTQQGQTEISQEEYNNIISIIKTVSHEEGYEYKLRDDLIWEKTKIDLQPMFDGEQDDIV